MKYLKFMPYNTVINASRNRREMIIAAKSGYEVFCYSRDRSVPQNTIEQPFKMICDETPVVSYSLPKIKRVFRIIYNKLRHIRTLRSLNMDVISCHNIDALALAWWSNLGKKNKAKLIYDSHEFELYKKPRGKVLYAITKLREGFLISHSAFSIMINQGIADEVKKIHHLTTEPVVVRSTPEYWEIDEEKVSYQKEEFYRRLNVSEDTQIVIYTGYLMEYRGLEELIGAMAYYDRFCAVLVGDPGNKVYESHIMELADKLGVSKRILRYPLQPQDQLWRFIAAAAAAIVMNDDKNPNYHWALPNKFFEAIQSLTPVICANSPEMSRIVNDYNIGALVPSGDAEKLAGAIRDLVEDSIRYKGYKNNLAKAKEDLCWEKESQILINAYKKYL